MPKLNLNLDHIEITAEPWTRPPIAGTDWFAVAIIWSDFFSGRITMRERDEALAPGRAALRLKHEQEGTFR